MCAREGPSQMQVLADLATENDANVAHIPFVQEGTVAIVALLGKQTHSQDSTALLKRGKRQLEEEMKRMDEKLDENEKVERATRGCFHVIDFTFELLTAAGRNRLRSVKIRVFRFQE